MISSQMKKVFRATLCVSEKFLKLLVFGNLMEGGNQVGIKVTLDMLPGVIADSPRTPPPLKPPW